jgi:hypothetical protein
MKNTERSLRMKTAIVLSLLGLASLLVACTRNVPYGASYALGPAELFPGHWNNESQWRPTMVRYYGGYGYFYDYPRPFRIPE